MLNRAMGIASKNAHPFGSILLTIVVFAVVSFISSPCYAQDHSPDENQWGETEMGEQGVGRYNKSQQEKTYAPFPTPDSGYVTDLANLLTQNQEEEIEQWLWHVEETSGVEIAVVTINSISDYPGTPN